MIDDSLRSKTPKLNRAIFTSLASSAHPAEAQRGSDAGASFAFFMKACILSQWKFQRKMNKRAFPVPLLACFPSVTIRLGHGMGASLICKPNDVDLIKRRELPTVCELQPGGACERLCQWAAASSAHRSLSVSSGVKPGYIELQGMVIWQPMICGG